MRAAMSIHRSAFFTAPESGPFLQPLRAHLKRQLIAPLTTSWLSL